MLVLELFLRLGAAWSGLLASVPAAAMWAVRQSLLIYGRQGAGAAHRGRAGGPARPIIPGTFLRRYLGRLLTYFDELNSVLQEIDHSFIYAKRKQERGDTNMKMLMFSLTMKTLPCLPRKMHLPGINEHVASILVTWLMSRIKSCETAHELAEDFTLVVEP